MLAQASHILDIFPCYLLSVSILAIIFLISLIFELPVFEALTFDLINSNFSANYFIDRNKFCNILKYKYNIHTMFDPCSYPGIQCKYYYNEIHTEQNGVCKCNHRCDKKGSGKSTNSCLEVSFMIFRTGSILIVGNCSKAILSIIYSFLVDILRREFKEIQIKGEPKKVKKKKKLRKQIIYIKI